jgi:molecular chaperone DnaJ
MATHYQTLQVTPRATASEIKRAYRELAKQHHPDMHGSNTATIDRMVAINAAYEILNDPQRKQTYDRSLQQSIPMNIEMKVGKGPSPKSSRERGSDLDGQIEQWLNGVYAPINRAVTAIIKPFKSQVLALSADPFDDDLLGAFESYLLDCQRHLKKAEKILHSFPNPSNLAGIAASLYHCLNRLSDAIEELTRYTTCYNDEYLSSGQELLKIAAELQKDAKRQLKMIS